MSFEKTNVNPKGLKVSDCVFRAIASAFNITWEEAYDKLCSIGRETKCSPNESLAYEQLLKDYDKISVMHETPKGKKRYTIQEICKWKGIYLVRVANHLACVKNGKLIDTWDCSNKSSYKIWKIK